MARTSDVKVRAVIETEAEHDLEQFITHANALVDRVNTCATGKSITLTSTELEIIETYLAAHFYALRYLQFSEKKTGRASVVIQGKTGMGLEATLWGQQALSLDPSGCLAEITGGNMPTVHWAGTTIE